MKYSVIMQSHYTSGYFSVYMYRANVRELLDAMAEQFPSYKVIRYCEVIS